MIYELQMKFDYLIVQCKDILKSQFKFVVLLRKNIKSCQDLGRCCLVYMVLNESRYVNGKSALLDSSFGNAFMYL